MTIKSVYGLLLLLLLFCLWVHPFLAVTRPVDAEVIVVEGWIPDASLKYAAKLFETHSCKIMLTVGGRIKDFGADNVGNTYAEVSRDKLIQIGVDGRKIISIKTDNRFSGRTFSSAKSMVEWVKLNRQAIKRVNVVTLGTHARKSYVLYQKAGGNYLKIGIISAPVMKYEPAWWFFSINGWEYVTKNFVGWLYAVGRY